MHRLIRLRAAMHLKHCTMFIGAALVLLSILAPSCREPVSPPLAGPAELDSTTHDFEWEIMNLGYHQTRLIDICAISDTDVWVVGDITERHPTGGSMPIHHNAAHWNGQEWRIVDIMISWPGRMPPISQPSTICAVFGFSHDNVIFVSGKQVQRWDGKKFIADLRPYDLLTGEVSGIWGANDKNVWFVGKKGIDQAKGFIVHYDGKQYKGFDPGFTDEINDIWGVGDTALCVASEWLFTYTTSKILRLTQGRVEPAYSDGLPTALYGIWFAKGMNPVATGGSDVRWDGAKWTGMPEVPGKWFRKGIRGNGPHDYFIAEETSGVLHWNGKCWKEWNFRGEADIFIMGLACSENNVWVIGNDLQDGGSGLIIHGRRTAQKQLMIGDKE